MNIEDLGFMKQNIVDPVDVPEGVLLDLSGNLYDLHTRGLITQWEAETGRRILWLFDGEGDLIL